MKWNWDSFWFRMGAGGIIMLSLLVVYAVIKLFIFLKIIIPFILISIAIYTLGFIFDKFFRDKIGL